MEKTKNSQEMWDTRYSQLDIGAFIRAYNRWLEPWSSVLESSRYTPILDLGCGVGLDSRFLLDNGFSVVAADFSAQALEAVARVAPQARREIIDVRKRLPFDDSAFHIIIANLSLHYFLSRQTQLILAEVHRITKPDGFLLARFNSTKDVHFGAAGNEEIEPGCFLVAGAIKHFFDSESLRLFFQNGWTIRHLAEVSLDFRGKPKIVWELAAQKRS